MTELDELAAGLEHFLTLPRVYRALAGIPMIDFNDWSRWDPEQKATDHYDIFGLPE